MVKKSLFVALIVAVLLSACAQVTTPAPAAAPTTAPAAKKVTVGFAAASAGWPWYATFIKTMENRAKAAGWELTVLGADANVATQVNQIQDLTARGVNYLIVGPLDGKAVVPGIKAAAKAGIKVIIIGNPVDAEGDDAVTATRVPDDYAMGKDSAELMVEALKGKGQIFVVEGLPGQPAVIAREKAYKDVFDKTEIKIVDMQPADWDSAKAVQVTEALLTRYPKIDGILSMDGSMTPSIFKVAKERGWKGPIVGLGGTATELPLVKDGSVYGTTCMSPGANANAAADAIDALAKGGKVEKFQIVQSPKTTQSNADKCPGDW